MKKIFTLLLLTGIASANAADLSPADQMYISQISQGGPVTVRDAARSIEASRNTNTQVLDVLAEAMLRDYKKDGKSYADEVAWSCKGLAASGNKRYFSAINEVAENAAGRNAKKHCSKAADTLGAADGEQYAAGMVSMDKMSKQAAKEAPKVQAANGKVSPITEVQLGMSLEQAYAIAGMPSNTTSYQTGKAWRPFNFKGADNYRTAALYKGQGRIVFSNDNQYSNNMKVMEIIVNPSETGFP